MVFMCLISSQFVALYEARITLENIITPYRKAHGTDDAESHQGRANSRPLDIQYRDCCFFPYQALRQIVSPSCSSAFTHAALTTAPNRLFCDQRPFLVNYTIRRCQFLFSMYIRLVWVALYEKGRISKKKGSRGSGSYFRDPLFGELLPKFKRWASNNIL